MIYTEGELLAIVWGYKAQGYTLPQTQEALRNTFTAALVAELWECLQDG